MPTLRAASGARTAMTTEQVTLRCVRGTRPPSRGAIAPEFCGYTSLERQRARGKPGAGRTRSLACKMKKHTSGSHYRFDRAGPGLPRASGFNGFLRALPGVRDVLVTVVGAMQSIVANLTPAKGRQDHTTSPSALMLFV